MEIFGVVWYLFWVNNLKEWDFKIENCHFINFENENLIYPTWYPTPLDMSNGHCLIELLINLIFKFSTKLESNLIYYTHNPRGYSYQVQ